MSEWIGDINAVKLICDARKVGEGAAVQLLINACAHGVRARQRDISDHRVPDHDWGLVIAASVWQGAHLDLDTGILYPAGWDFDNPPIDERGFVQSGYGLGGNGIIEISESDLSEHLKMPAPRKPGRKSKVTPEVEQKVFAMLDHHGVPSPDDSEWSAQADVEEVIEDLAGVGRTQARIHARRLIDKWKAGKGR
jgi:hypothetical protein